MIKSPILTKEKTRLNIHGNLFEHSNNPTENVELNYSIRSRLRYPGGKTRGVGYITQFFPKNLDKLLSPFFGGSSIELSLSAKGTVVYGYDIFSPLSVQQKTLKLVLYPQLLWLRKDNINCKHLEKEIMIWK